MYNRWLQYLLRLNNNIIIQLSPTFLFGSTADGERMPLVLGDNRHVDEDVVAGPEVKARRPFDYEMRDLGGQQQARADVGFAALGVNPGQPTDPLDREDRARHDEPLPEVRPMEDHQQPEGDVEEVGPVEHLRSGKVGRFFLLIWKSN